MDSAAFKAAAPIIENKCGVCHYTPEIGDFKGTKESEYLAQGWIKKGNPEGSKLYYRMKGSAGTNGPKDMPQGRGTMSADELKKVYDWIKNIK